MLNAHKDDLLVGIPISPWRLWNLCGPSFNLHCVTCLPCHIKYCRQMDLVLWVSPAGHVHVDWKVVGFRHAAPAPAHDWKCIILAEKIRAKLEFFKRALRGYTRPLAVSFSSLWILHPLCLTWDTFIYGISWSRTHRIELWSPILYSFEFNWDGYIARTNQHPTIKLSIHFQL